MLMKLKFYFLLFLITTCVGALSAETVTDTYTFDKTTVTSNKYFGINDYSTYLPDGWFVKAGSYSWRINPNQGVNGGQCLMAPNNANSFPAQSIIFYAKKGTLSFNMKAYGYQPEPTLKLYKATADGASTDVVATKTTGEMNLSGSEYKIITIDIAEDGYVALSLDASTCVNDVKNTYEAAATTYSISGKVTDEAGAAVEGVTVSTTGKSATTDASGAYTLAELAAGTYTLTASKAGYKTSTKELTITDADITNGDIALSPDESRLTGKITSMSDSSPVADALLALTPAGAAEPAATATSGADGSYTLTITGLVADSYTLTISRKYYKPFTQTVAAPWGIPQGGEKILNPQIEVKRIGFTLTLTTADDTPVTGATVTVGELGNATASDTEPGKYVLGNLNAVTLADNKYTVTVSQADCLPVQAFDVQFDGENVERSLVMTPIPDTSIVGTVTDATTHAAIAGASVQLYTADAPMAISSATTDAEGIYTFTIPGTPAPEYTVTVEADYYEAGSTKINEPERGKEITADLALTPLTYTFTATVEGKDVGDVTAAVTDATVTLSDGDDAITATGKGDGTYEATVSRAAAQGKQYTVTVTAPGYLAADAYKFTFAGADASHTFTLETEAYAGIGAIGADSLDDATPVYDLYGRRIAADKLKNLPAGIYIRKGQKISVR